MLYDERAAGNKYPPLMCYIIVHAFPVPSFSLPVTTGQAYQLRQASVLDRLAWSVAEVFTGQSCRRPTVLRQVQRISNAIGGKVDKPT